MSEQFTVEIISPNEQTLKAEAREVSLPAFEGEIGILKNHIPLITFLRPGLIKIISETDQIYLVEDGTVEFSNNNLLILTSTAKSLDSLEKNSIDIIIKTIILYFKYSSKFIILYIIYEKNYFCNFLVYYINFYIFERKMYLNTYSNYYNFFFIYVG